MKNKSKSLLAAMGTVAVWAMAFPLSKYVMQYMTPLDASELRIIFGGVLLLGVAFMKGIQWPKGRDWIFFVLAGLTGNIFYQIVFNLGLQTIPAATSSMIVSSTPLLTAILMQFIYKEKLSYAGWLYTFTAFIGVGLVLLWKGAWQLEIGAFWTLLAMIMFAWYNVFNRQLSTVGYNAINIAAWSMFLGGLIGIPFLPGAIKSLLIQPTLVWGALFVLTFFSTAIGFALWSYALEKAEKASDVMNFLYISPLVAAVLSFLLLGEIPNVGFFIGGTVIISSLYLFNKYR